MHVLWQSRLSRKRFDFTRVRYAGTLGFRRRWRLGKPFSVQVFRIERHQLDGRR